MNQPIFIALAVMASGRAAKHPPAFPAPPFPQLTPVVPVMAFDVQVDLSRMQSDLARAQQELAHSFAKGWPGAVIAFQGRTGTARSDAEYDQGTRALDDHRYEDAVRQ